MDQKSSINLWGDLKLHLIFLGTSLTLIALEILGTKTSPVNTSFISVLKII